MKSKSFYTLLPLYYLYMDRLRGVIKQNSDSSLITFINNLIKVPLITFFSRLQFVTPVSNIAYIGSIAYLLWGVLSLSVFGSIMLSLVYIKGIPVTEVTKPWLLLLMDLYSITWTPSISATVFAGIYTLAIYIYTSSSETTVNVNDPKSHSIWRFGFLFGVAILGAVIVLTITKIGAIIVLGSVFLCMLYVRLLIQADRKSSTVIYKDEKWLIVTRVWFMWSIVYILLGGSVMTGILVSFGSFIGTFYFLTRRQLDTENSLYTRVSSVSEFITENPWQYSRYANLLSSDKNQERTDTLNEATEQFDSKVDVEKQYLDDLYYTLLEFEDEYTRFSSVDELNPKAVYSMSKTELESLHSEISDIESQSKSSAQLQNTASRLRRKIEKVLQEA
jgi:hypothetical protein